MKLKLAITVTLSGWIFSGTYIFVEYILLKNYTISHFFLPEDTPHLILHLMVVFAPFVSTSMGYLVNQRTSLLKSLKKSEERYRDLYQNAPDGYHSIGPDGTILEVNDTWLKMLGHERNEVIGRLKITDILNDNSFKTFEKNYPVFKEKGYIENVELDFRKKDGGFLPVAINATAIYDVTGNFLKSRSIVRDNYRFKG
ncbi:MAG: PAS domain-containing protein [Nitrospirae bacterium]|nr:PAS domain-containing protein [Nitrospirota bacterium]